MDTYTMHPIGFIRSDKDGFRLELLPRYAPALEGLAGFSHVQVIWWFDGCDNPASRSKLTMECPYKRGPAVLGTFASRSPERPNPIAVTVAGITYMDMEKGIVGLTYTDANDGTPLLDIKPYTPSLDRVLNPAVPDWCGNWPTSIEESGSFDWSDEFNF